MLNVNFTLNYYGFVAIKLMFITVLNFVSIIVISFINDSAVIQAFYHKVELCTV